MKIVECLEEIVKKMSTNLQKFFNIREKNIVRCRKLTQLFPFGLVHDKNRMITLRFTICCVV